MSTHEFLMNYGWAIWLVIGLFLTGIFVAIDQIRITLEDPEDLLVAGFMIVAWPISLGILIGRLCKWMAKPAAKIKEDGKPDPVDYEFRGESEAKY
jgi:hypothetical protein